MFLNYIKIALRNILRNRLHSIINIMGLAMGIACAVLLLLAVREMESYDKHHSKHERIYMVESDFSFIGKQLFSYGTSIAVGPTLKDEYTVIEDFVRIIPSSRVFFYNDKNEIIGEEGICFADPSIFNILDHHFIYGSPGDALESPKTIVLSKSLAQKYFGDVNPVGKILKRNNDINYTVTGVFEDLSKNTMKHYSALMPMRDYAMFVGMENFNSREPGVFFNASGSHTTLILLHKNADISTIKNDLERFHKKYIEDEVVKRGNDLHLVFEPLGDVFLNYRPSTEMPPIYLMTISLLIVLIIFILAVASINYTNIVTAQSEARAKEVGIRKVMGANRVTLMRQFLCESIVMALAALIIALVLVELSLPLLNEFTGRNIEFSVFMKPDIAVDLFILILAVGFLSGSYPALFLSSFLPARVLRGSGQAGKRKGRLRKLLVIVQFTLAIIVINFTFIFQKYVDFWLNADLGFHAEDILIIENNDPKVKKVIPLFKEELLKNRNIIAVSGTFNKVGSNSRTGSIKVENTENKMVDFHTANLGIDFEFVDMLELELLEGRNFNSEVATDADQAFLVTENFVKDMGWKNSPINKRIQFGGNEGRVIGVVKNFHYISVIAGLRPMVIFIQKHYLTEGAPVTYIKINSQDKKKTLEFIEQKWKEHIPSYPFEYQFLEDSIARQYDFPKKLYKIFQLFSILCIFISSLGLFGLSSFVAEKRTREIGIRKVYGASVRGIVIKVSYSFLKLTLLSGIIGSILFNLSMGKMGAMWKYSPEINLYNINITVMVIVLSIAFITVSYHAVKAALTDPVKALRYE